MRPAPPLVLQCAPSRAWRFGCAFIGAAAASAVSAWAAGHLEWALPARFAISGLAAALGVVLGLRIAGPSRYVELRWDGRDWQADGRTGALQVMLDFDRWLLLLRHRPGDSAHARWLAISFVRGSDERRALCTALYSAPPESNPEPPQVRAPDRVAD